MTRYVLDTSVVVKWFTTRDESDVLSAVRLRDGIVSGAHGGIVPDLVFYELANALRYNPRLTPADAKDAVATVIDMGLTVVGVEPELVGRALEIAFECEVTVYDAYFVALAEGEGAAFVTADYRLYEKVSATGNCVRLDSI